MDYKESSVARLQLQGSSSESSVARLQLQGASSESSVARLQLQGSSSESPQNWKPDVRGNILFLTTLRVKESVDWKVILL